MNKLIISLGSNSSDRERQMECAVQHLTQILSETVMSDIYESPAHNGVDAPYLNAVMLASTTKSIDEVNAAFKQWEKECGRTPESKSQGVIPIDLDVVVWNGEVIRATDYSRDYVSKGVAQLLHRLL